MLSKNLFGCCGVEEIDEKNSYEKINSNYVKYDRTNEILNESITPDNSDDEEEKEQNANNQEIIDKKIDEKNVESKDNEKMNNNNKNRNTRNIYESIYSISTLKISDEKNQKMPDNIQIIKNRIGSIISKGNYTGESTTKIKNEDKKIEYIKENVIISENENEKDEEKKNQKNEEEDNEKNDNDQKDYEKKIYNNNKKNKDDSESDIDDDSDDSSDEINSYDS
jgi:hypothetical protein